MTYLIKYQYDNWKTSAKGWSETHNGPWHVCRNSVFQEYEARLGDMFVAGGFSTLDDAQLFADSHPEILNQWLSFKARKDNKAEFEDWARWLYRMYGGHAPSTKDSQLDSQQQLVRKNMSDWANGGTL